MQNVEIKVGRVWQMNMPSNARESQLQKFRPDIKYIQAKAESFIFIVTDFVKETYWATCEPVCDNEVLINRRGVYKLRPASP
jgi:hypothetical protein